MNEVEYIDFDTDKITKKKYREEFSHNNETSTEIIDLKEVNKIIKSDWEIRELIAKQKEEQEGNMVKLKLTRNLAVNDIDKNNPIATVIEEGGYETFGEGTDEERELFKIRVELPNGDKKLYVPNKTTQQELAAKWGDETKSWIGKIIKFSIVKQNVPNKGLTDVLYGYPKE